MAIRWQASIPRCSAWGPPMPPFQLYSRSILYFANCLAIVLQGKQHEPPALPLSTLSLQPGAQPRLMLASVRLSSPSASRLGPLSSVGLLWEAILRWLAPRGPAWPQGGILFPPRLAPSLPDGAPGGQPAEDSFPEEAKGAQGA